MANNYTRAQLIKLYIGLPEELKETFNADETITLIEKACGEDTSDDECGRVTNLTMNVLLGILPPQNFQGFLEKEVGLKPGVAKRIGQEINRFVFFPVKEALAALYKPVATATTAEAKQMPESPMPAAEETSEAPRPISKTSDDYQEKIE